MPPLYTYECTLCLKRAEKERRIEARNDPVFCPSCGLEEGSSRRMALIHSVVYGIVKNPAAGSS